MNRTTSWFTGVVAGLGMATTLLAQERASGIVGGVDFAAGILSQINLNSLQNCPAAIPAYLAFDNATRVELGHDNPVDSSELLVARRVEFDCGELGGGGPARKIIIKEISETDVPLTPAPPADEIGDFIGPLQNIIEAVRDFKGLDRFHDVADGPDSRDGVFATRTDPLKSMWFRTGDCRILPAPEHFQCDFAHSNRLANLLRQYVKEAVENANEASGELGGLLVLERPPDGTSVLYVDRFHRMAVRLTSEPPKIILSVEVF